jgi:LysM repeat protein
MAYVVKAGDTLSSIAARNGTTVSALLAANPRKWPNPNLIQVGQTVLFPGETRGTIPSAQRLPIRRPGTGENSEDSLVNLMIPRSESSPRRPRAGENPADSLVNLPIRGPGTGEKREPSRFIRESPASSIGIFAKET